MRAYKFGELDGRKQYYVMVLGFIMTADHDLKEDSREGVFFETPEEAIAHANRWPRVDGRASPSVFGRCRMIDEEGYGHEVAKQGPGISEEWTWSQDRALTCG